MAGDWRSRPRLGAKGIKRSARGFRDELRELLAAGKHTPSTWLLRRLNDPKVDAATRDEIAGRLIGFELPRLAAIEAEVTSVEKSHEEWLSELEDEAAEGRVYN